MNFPSLSNRLRAALREDSAFNDVTTRLLPNARHRPAKAVLLAKEHGVFCGQFLLAPVFKQLDPRVRAHPYIKDGDRVRPGQRVAELKGTLAAVLAGERLYLNLACHLSGIATLTRKFADEVRGTSARVYDTRKTTPLWRDLEKYAVICGGGENHRFSLGDAVLVKDNHIAADRARFSDGPLRPQLKKRVKFIEMEAKTLAEVWAALRAESDIVLLDNMPVTLLKKAIVLVQSARAARGTAAPLIEISGGVTLKRVRKLAELGVDRISVGALTHSAPSLDLSLEVV